ncbi:HAD family hydrolase [Candidatus Uhrbacteria bacterium]|nr:HAD family hydrolase [Candidatus Uhrbacteria bacterium]
MRRPIRRIMFWDYNGTLLHDCMYVYEGYVHVFRRFGIAPPPFEVWRDQVVPAYPTFYWECGIPCSVSGEEINALLLEALATIAPPLPFPDAVEVVQHCAFAGITCIVVSGFPKDHIIATLDRLQFRACFADVVGTIAQKTLTLQRYLAAFQCAPHEALLVGDTVFDAEAAHAASIPSCICPRSGYHPRDRIEGARARIPSMTIVEDLHAVLRHVFEEDS